ncbi:hypothetical protein, partial [Tritonibacter sp. SIMBA_163]|uniref:hypothetical protein n=1 Tax=Tritonibacter sp. SIMBA_163 TaxID=3080868 RepID=UPI0039803204
LDELEVRDPDPEVLLGFLSGMEVRTLTKRLADQLGQEAPPIPETAAPAAQADLPEAPGFDSAESATVRDAETLQQWIDR